MLHWLTSPAINQKTFPAETSLVWVQARKTEIRVHMYVLHMWIISLWGCVCAVPIHSICDITSWNLTACSWIISILTKSANQQQCRMLRGNLYPCAELCVLTWEAAVFGQKLVQCEWVHPGALPCASTQPGLQQQRKEMSGVSQLQEKLLHKMCCHSLKCCSSGHGSGQQNLSFA